MMIENKNWFIQKKAPCEVLCRLESYKEKRSVCFSANNMNPQEAYHFILIGEKDGGLIHQEFSPIHADAKGGIRFYQTFEGEELQYYKYCIFGVIRQGEQMDIIYRGSLVQEKREEVCEALYRHGKGIEPFTPACDEINASWHRVEASYALPEALMCCKEWIDIYGHYIIGKKNDKFYIGIPGRFLQREQPLRRKGVFQLWQPIRGGEDFFDVPDKMTERQMEEIYGYWIAGITSEDVGLVPL